MIPFIVVWERCTWLAVVRPCLYIHGGRHLSMGSIHDATSVVVNPFGSESFPLGAESWPFRYGKLLAPTTSIVVVPDKGKGIAQMKITWRATKV